MLAAGQAASRHTSAAPNSSRTVGETVLEMRGVDKRFPGVHALKRVDLTLCRGEVLGLVGENGAGKSTLMKILSGAYSTDEGQVTVFGNQIANPTPQSMLALGVAVIYQELVLAPHLTVAENIFVGKLPRNRLGLIDWKRLNREASSEIRKAGFSLDPKLRVDELSVAQRQVVEIVKALSRDAKIVVLDEPSAVLGDADVAKLFDVIRRLAAEKGISFIYISHRLKEVFEICDRVCILRDGQVISTSPTPELTRDILVKRMVGRELTDYFPARSPQPGPVALSVRDLTRDGVFKDVSFDVHEGEILGICGLAGAGRTEILRAIVGADPIDGGSCSLHGVPVKIASPRQAIRLGMGLVPEDRKLQGLFLQHPVYFNVTLSRLKEFLTWGIIRLRKERDTVQGHVRSLRVKTPSIYADVRNLSGGNQQKCVVANKLNARCRVLLIDEPTRGVDVGAKREIYQVLVDLVDRERSAVVMVSSELPEVLGLSDRILVVQQGRIAAELTRKEASEEAIMQHAV